MGLIYSIKIRAVNEENMYSNYSDVAVIGFGNLPPKPLIPTYDFNTIFTTSVMINWTPVTIGVGDLPILGYILKMKDDNQINYAIAYNGNLSSLTLSYSVSGLNPFAIYYFIVSSVDINGVSIDSDSLYITACGKPSGFKFFKSSRLVN